MAELDLEVRKPSLGQSKGPHTIAMGAVARLRRLDSGVREREQSIAVGIGTHAQRIVDLSAGSYEIQLLLPSGRIMAQQVTLRPNGVEHVVFDIDAAPNSVLAWQQFAGQVAPPLPPRLATRQMKTIMPAADELQTGAFMRNFAGQTEPAMPLEDFSLLTIEVQPTLEEKTLDPKRVSEVWRLLVEGVRGAIKPADMIKGFFKRAVEPADQDELHDSWQFDFTTGYEAGKRPTRYYAVVRGEHVHELVSMPLPWRMGQHGNHRQEDAIIDLLVDKSAARTGARSSVVVRDSAYGGLIAYMGTGAIGLAGEMMRARPDLEEVALDMLGAKSRSPLGACAAAYVLLATREWTAEASARELPWQQWVRNLNADPLYNWIPDAAILCARMTLQRAETPEEARDAIPYLHRALRNGLPFYALGYRWLLEAMRFCLEDPLIKSVYGDVDRVGRYVDVTQAFVALQLTAPEE